MEFSKKKWTERKLYHFNRVNPTPPNTLIALEITISSHIYIYIIIREWLNRYISVSKSEWSICFSLHSYYYRGRNSLIYWNFYHLLNDFWCSQVKKVGCEQRLDLCLELIPSHFSTIIIFFFLCVQFVTNREISNLNKNLDFYQNLNYS